MTASLSGRTIAFLATDGVEQVELTEPWAAVERAGGRPELIGLKPGEIQGVNHDEKGDSFVVDKSVGEAAAGLYDGLVLPGGTRNPDRLRMDKDAVGFVRSFFDAGKPVTDPAMLQSCFDCHRAVKETARDFVFTHYAP